MAKMTVTLNNENVQSLLHCDLTCVQSVIKDLIEYVLETKVEQPVTLAQPEAVVMTK